MPDFREMKTDDHEKCTHLWNQTEGMGFLENDTIESVSFYLERNPGMSFVCYDEEKLVGTILGGHDGRRGYIYHLAVDRNYRGKSIGKTLLNFTLEKLKLTGLKRCIIMLKSDNKANAKFWTDNGYTAREDLNMYSIDF